LPGLIYQAIFGNIQDIWLQDYNPNQHPCFFALSPTGWINNDFGYTWLDIIFNREIKAKACNRKDWRLFIFDGHGFYVNIRFFKYLWQYIHLI